MFKIPVGLMTFTLGVSLLGTLAARSGHSAGFFGRNKDKHPCAPIGAKLSGDATGGELVNQAKGLLPTLPIEQAVGTHGVSFDPEVAAQNLLPKGSALATSSGDLAKTGITQIIHAASAAMGSGKPGDARYEPSQESIANAVANSLELARANGHRRVAIPFIGGGIFAGRLGMPLQELADLIVKTGVENAKNLEVRFVTFGPQDTGLFTQALAKHPTSQAQVLDGSLTDFNLHGASAIVNAANMEVVFGGGLSGVIARAVGDSEAINQEARQAIQAFYKANPVR